MSYTTEQYVMASALAAIVGDAIELALLEIPESPAMAITRVMMQWGIDPTQMEQYQNQANRRGFSWPK